MTARRGFTLMEVMLALVVGSVVVLLAYATLRAGTDVEARVSAAREADQTTATLRAMLGDAIRHAVAGDARDADGVRADVDATGRTTKLTFISRGVMPPLGGSDAWQVGLSADTAGVTFDAVALDSSRAPLRLTVRGPRAFAVRFLAAEDNTWRNAWNDATRLPAAMELRFLDADGRELMAPLLARTAPVSGL